MGYFCDQRGAPVRYVDSLVREITLMRDLCAFVEILRLIWRENPDVIHTHLAKAGFLGRLAALALRPFGIRPILVHTYHGHVFHSYFSNRQNSLHLFLERLCARWTDRIIAVSDRLKTELIHSYDIAPAENFRVIPLGFDLSPFRNQPRRAGIFRKNINVGERVPLIGIVGRLTAVKDHPFFLECYLDILKACPTAVAVIVGDGEENERIRTHADRLGIRDRVRWTGFLKNLPEVYSDLDVLALTSKNEGTPVAVIEAQACGCPVVCTDVGGTADAMPDREGGQFRQNADDVVIERAGGILVRRRDSSLFARACLDVIEGRFRPEAAVREQIARRFSVERLCEDVAHLYRNTLTALRPIV